MNAKEFIDTVSPFAVTLRMEGSPMFPSVRIAQNMLETGRVIHPWFNLGGIKVGSGKPNGFWKGASVNKGTWEVCNGVTVNTSANFRAYDNLYDFYKDQDLLFLNDRYKRVVAAKNPQEQAEMLQACGYATDPQYPEKLKSIISQNGLEKYDQEAENMKEELAAAIKRIDALELKTKVLDKTPAPEWFIKEFGEHVLDGIVSDMNGDTDFWRDTAVSLRLKKKG